MLKDPLSVCGVEQRHLTAAPATGATQSAVAEAHQTLQAVALRTVCSHSRPNSIDAGHPWRRCGQPARQRAGCGASWSRLEGAPRLGCPRRPLLPMLWLAQCVRAALLSQGCAGRRAHDVYLDWATCILPSVAGREWGEGSVLACDVWAASRAARCFNFARLHRSLHLRSAVALRRTEQGAASSRCAASAARGNVRQGRESTCKPLSLSPRPRPPPPHVCDASLAGMQQGCRAFQHGAGPMGVGREMPAHDRRGSERRGRRPGRRAAPA
jgi:hypothetical protein